MSKHLLIDADLLHYRSCTTEAEASYQECINFFNNIVEYILWECLDFPTEDNYTLYLTGKGNFRKDLYPDYKANRKISPLPNNFFEVKDYISSLPNTVVCNGYEADDGISMEAHKRGFKNVMIVSSDKDFKQIPVEIYNTYHWKKERVSKAEARRNFWTQVLVGDSVDNIKGCRGIGLKKATAILKGLSKEDDYQREVFETFLSRSPKTGEEDYLKAYTLIKLLTNEKELSQYV